MPFRSPEKIKQAVLRAFVCVALIAGAAGCMPFEPLKRDIATDQDEANRALEQITPSQPKRTALVVDDRPWFGSSAIPLQNGEPLPAQLMDRDGIVMTFERPLRLLEAARTIQAATGIRVSVDYGQGAEDGEASLKTFVPVDGREVAGGRIVWQGNLPDLLDQLSDTFDADWNYDGKIIRISQEVTRTFMLHALADTVDFSNELKSGEGDEDSAVPKLEIKSNATLAIWAEIQSTINTMLGSRGRATYSPSTGTVTVNAPKSLVSKVEKYLREQNSMRLRRVAVALKVLAVQTSDLNELSFNLSGLLEHAVRGRPFQFKSVGDGLTAGILRTMPAVDSVSGFPAPDNALGTPTAPSTDTITSLLEASEEIDRVSLVHSGAVVTLSDIPAPLQIGRSVAYLQRVSSTTTADSTSTSLEPGEINLGLTMNVLPRVIQKDRILLRLAIGITDAEVPFQTFTAGGLTIQLPEVDTTGFLQNAVISGGETLVLAGFEKNQSGINEEGAPGGLWTGGSRTLVRGREVTVLLITAEVLPEDPLTVIGE